MYTIVRIMTLLALLKVSTTHAQGNSSESLLSSARHIRILRASGHSPLNFGYTKKNGPATWPNKFPLCGGTRQSPIDLNTATMQRVCGKRLYWTASSCLWPTNMTLRNNGHNVELSGTWDPLPTPELRGGPLDGGYTFWNMHFHWGRVDTRGSEHTVKGKSYPLELHAVHYKTSYGSFSNAMKFPDGLAVVGYLYKISSKACGKISTLISALSSVRSPETAVSVKPIPLSSLLAPIKGYVTYQGSLTTPPCTEGVTWLVPDTLHRVSTTQLAAFRSLLSDDGAMVDNFRPTQPLNGRLVLNVKK